MKNAEYLPNFSLKRSEMLQGNKWKTVAEISIKMQKSENNKIRIFRHNKTKMLSEHFQNLAVFLKLKIYIIWLIFIPLSVRPSQYVNMYVCTCHVTKA